MATRGEQKRKLTFKDKHALETLPKKIEELQALMAKLQKDLDDPKLYAKDPARFAKLSKAFAEAEAQVAKCEEDWLALEMLREEIEG